MSYVGSIYVLCPGGSYPLVGVSINQFLSKSGPQVLAVTAVALERSNLLVFPWDAGRKLNIRKAFKRSPGRLLNVLRTFNLRPVPGGKGFDQRELKELP